MSIISPLFSVFSLWLFSLSLVPFEVLNNERATLPVKLVGKSRQELRGTVQHGGIMSLEPQEEEEEGGTIRSTVSGDSDRLEAVTTLHRQWKLE